VENANESSTIANRKREERVTQEDRSNIMVELIVELGLDLI